MTLTDYRLIGGCIQGGEEAATDYHRHTQPEPRVACDAKQIVHARRHQLDGNRVTYTAGAIEVIEINERLVDILRGT